MQVAFQTLGCRLNEAETEAWSRQFRAAGARVVPPDRADVVVLNTCAVTGEAARKSRQWIRRLRRANPDARLVVSGCYASLRPEQVARELGVDLVVPNRDKNRLVELARRLLPAPATTGHETPGFTRSRQRAFVKVQDGCRHRCTFCIVTVARGEERSRPVAEVVAEIQALRREGVQEAVLSGVHLGGYGSDLGSSLTELLRAVLERTDLPRLRLGSLEPWELGEDFFTLFRDPRLMPHLHLPLQSGSDAVLKRMARRCRVADFRTLVSTARRHCPDLVLTTDIIVGFPGETEADFQKTLALVEEIGFAHVHIFPYSPREGTAAAAFPHEVDEKTKKDRSSRLHRLAAALRRRVLDAWVGKTAAVLWEKGEWRDGRRWFSGYTPHYLRVQIPAPEGTDLSNRIQTVRLTAVAPEGDRLVAEPV
ncbi:threonylcarbamoyladenosine tRNA methylthiotransferase MtaB [Methylomarinovum caldicuralii]|uniref:Threonylcarbamoyladenosine tRNA methylthiotransferase MtaB n=1 Tax=Methylomarinovum caldicuralii TaxID=438856 RepID=A0AAU9C1M1_9GAMM|nr:tRNA (N(6)-L-threonylcarbamoyladenosine(37)-C(2))-methylthiotransferase MtaB [Methylomarinovum caldicuralii]BCX80994.1 threonylcarbamoyladenosine tRNA methylthiotransferase MtaB [Methylomarinovum caldicuralii]